MATVFITGGSSGIGKELAKLFARKGYDLVLLSKNMENLKAAKREIEEKFSVNCTLIQCDLRNRDDIYRRDIAKIMEEAIPHILINCAGAGKISKTVLLSLEEEEKMLNLNLISPIILSRIFLDIFLKKKKGNAKGAIINICSMASIYPHPYLAGYSGSKAGLLFYSLSLNEELRREKSEISVFSICPGTVSTNFFHETTKKKFGWMSRYSMSPERAAVEIVKSFEKNKTFTIIGRENRIMFKLLGLFPIMTRIRILGKILGKGI